MLPKKSLSYTSTFFNASDIADGANVYGKSTGGHQKKKFIIFLFFMLFSGSFFFFLCPVSEKML